MNYQNNFKLSSHWGSFENNTQMGLVPMVVEQVPGGERSYDLFSRLMKDRIILLNTAVTDVSTSIITSQLLFLNSQDKEKEIQFYINSPGGIVSGGYAIYDTMKHIEAPVHTVCMGMAASMGSFLLAGGDKRSILPSARVMIHQPLGGVQGQASDIEIEAKEIVKIKEKLTRDFAQNCSQDYEKVQSDMDRNYWLNAQEAKDYGIVDSVL